MQTFKQNPLGRVTPCAPTVHSHNFPVPAKRQAIFNRKNVIRCALIGACPNDSDVVKLRELAKAFGLVAAYPPVLKHTLEGIVGHTMGWVRTMTPNVDVCDMVNFERERQRILFAHGEIDFDVSKSGVDEDLKLQVLMEECGEVAEAVDKLRQAETARPGASRAHGIRKAMLHLCAELTQVAAVATAWLEALEVQS